MNFLSNIFVPFVEIYIVVFAIYGIISEFKWIFPALQKFESKLLEKYPEYSAIAGILFYMYVVFATWKLSILFILLLFIDELHARNEDLWNKSRLYRMIDILIFLSFYVFSIFLVLLSHNLI